MRNVVVGLLVVCLAGCSYLVSRPPGRPRVGAAPCHVSSLPALYDTWNAVGGGVLALWMLGQAEGSDADTMGALAAITGAVSAGFAASAAYGFKNVRKCGEQRARPQPILVEHGLPPGYAGTQEEEIEEVIELRRRTIRRRTIWP